MKHNTIAVRAYEDDQCRIDLGERTVDFELEAVKIAVNELLRSYDDEYCVSIELVYERGDDVYISKLVGSNHFVEREFFELKDEVELAESLIEAFGNCVHVNHTHNYVTFGRIKFCVFVSNHNIGTIYVNDISVGVHGNYSKHVSRSEVVSYLLEIKDKK